MYNIKKGEIIYCNLTVQHGNKEIVIKEVVYKFTDGNYNNRAKLKSISGGRPLKVLNIELIKPLGYEIDYNIERKQITIRIENKNNERNKKTGAYD